MFYDYFRFFNWICSIFGLRKPFNSLDAHGKCRSLIFWNKLWAISIVICVIVAHLLFIDLKLEFHIKNDLNEICDINNILINAVILLIHVTNDNNLYIKTYKIVNKMLSELKLTSRSIEMMAIKLCMWFSIQALVFLLTIIIEFIFGHPPYVMIIRIPLFLSMYHLFIHLCLVVAILKIINFELIEMLKANNMTACKIFFLKSQPTSLNIFYFMDNNIYFIDTKPKGTLLDVKFMCKIYDDLCTCIHLLQKYHGLEMLLTLWLMFTSAVTSITLISNAQTEYPWLEIIKSLEVYVWFSVACCVDAQIQQEVAKTDLLLIKNMIDVKCDPVRKDLLQLFKDIVSSNRLQFIACNLYRLNYATILGTIMGVITYSIISIQLF